MGANLNSTCESGFPTVAFFDVDDTLMRGFTIASYVHFIKGELQDERLVGELLDLERRAPRYQSREALVTECFRLLAGQSWAQLWTWGQEWYQRVGRGLLIPEAADRLAAHRRRKDTIVLVSGSWLPCLLPLADDLGAQYVYGCDLEVVGGALTGKVLTVMIGPAKAATVRAFAARHQIDLARCFAYGDDASDTDMLSLVGHPVAVRPTPALAEVAATYDWDVLRS